MTVTKTKAAADTAKENFARSDLYIEARTAREGMVRRNRRVVSRSRMRPRRDIRRREVQRLVVVFRLDD